MDLFVTAASIILHPQWKRQAWLCVDRSSEKGMVRLRRLLDIKMYVSAKQLSLELSGKLTMREKNLGGISTYKSDRSRHHREKYIVKVRGSGKHSEIV